MAYIDPAEVTSPQANISDLRPILDRGEESWSAALLKWNGSHVVGLRWNGWSESPEAKPHPGNPQSRGLPTWFVVPNEVATAVLYALTECGLGGGRIVVDQARQWVEETLQQLNSPDMRSEEFVRRVKEIVKEMKEAGEI